MKQVVHCLLLGVVAVLVMSTAAPGLVRVVEALVPLVLVVGVVVAVLQVIRYLTRQ